MYGPVAVTLPTDEKKRACSEPGSVMSRSSEVTTAWALNGVPSLKTMPWRNWIV